MNWYLQVIRKYADFSGRARRREYWWFVLFNVIIAFLLGMIDGMTGMFHEPSGWGVLGGLYTLFVLVPSLSVGARRLHDTDRSGWWLLLILVPIVGPIVLLVMFIMDGNAGDNRFGPDPKTALVATA